MSDWEEKMSSTAWIVPSQSLITSTLIIQMFIKWYSIQRLPLFCMSCFTLYFYSYLYTQHNVANRGFDLMLLIWYSSWWINKVTLISVWFEGPSIHLLCLKLILSVVPLLQKKKEHYSYPFIIYLKTTMPTHAHPSYTLGSSKKWWPKKLPYVHVKLDQLELMVCVRAHVRVCSRACVCVCVLTCQMERCGVASLCIPAVDVPWAAEFFHPSQTAFLCSIQKRRVSPQQVLDVCVPLLHQVQRRVPITILLGGICAMLGTQTGVWLYLELEYENIKTNGYH